MKKEILSVRSLSFEYEKNIEIFSNISFSLNKGEILGILGPSGLGKSTLLRLITGLEKPKTGEISYYDSILSSNKIFVPPNQRGIGLVVQEKALFPHLSSLENVKFGIKGSNREKNIKAQNFLKLLKAEKFADSYPNSLSGGQQQRVAIARALAPEPDLVLLDEPFSSLDKDLREELRRETKILFKKTNTSSIIVTHEMEEAKDICDKIIKLEQGKILNLTI